MRRWAGVNHAFLRRFLPYAGSIPSHDTLNDVINALDWALFSQCLGDWVDGLREATAEADGPQVVATDGKPSRRTHDRGKTRGPLHMVSASAPTLCQP